MGDAVFMTFAFIRPHLDENAAKYQEICEKRAKSGASGGRPKKQTDDGESKQKQKKAKKAIGFSEKQTEAKKPDNENENENEDDNDNDLNHIFLHGAPQADSEPAVIELILNDRTAYEVTQRQVEEWEKLYPAVDIMGELRKMVGWLGANPRKRKTRRGILQFITSWLAREQDKGGSRYAKSGYQPGVSSTPHKKSYDLEAYERETMEVPDFE